MGSPHPQCQMMFTSTEQVSLFNPQNCMSLPLAEGQALLQWLGYELDPVNCFGLLEASDLAARCRRRLWPEFRESGSSHSHPPQEHARRLLRLAERVGEGTLAYG